jgi:hypothetical protein
VPEIPVKDINEAAPYYERKLAFTLNWGGEEWGWPASHTDTAGPSGKLEVSNAIGNVGPVLTWLNLGSKQDADDLYRRWSTTEAKLISAPSRRLGFARVHRGRSGWQI